jgi:hypothetical protein
MVTLVQERSVHTATFKIQEPLVSVTHSQTSDADYGSEPGSRDQNMGRSVPVNVITVAGDRWGAATSAHRPLHSTVLNIMRAAAHATPPLLAVECGSLLAFNLAASAGSTSGGGCSQMARALSARK